MMRKPASVPSTLTKASLAAFSLAGLALAAAAVMAPRPADAAYNLPWCAHFAENDVTSCAYMTYEQCIATVGGPVGGQCTQNPGYPSRPPYVERRHRKAHASRN